MITNGSSASSTLTGASRSRSVVTCATSRTGPTLPMGVPQLSNGTVASR
jgi:hypothetical protein